MIAPQSAKKLYSPKLLSLATQLANFPPEEGLPLHYEARSQTCGSTIAIGLELDQQSRIGKCGMKVSACAVGQAAAAIFAAQCGGKSRPQIAAILEEINAWLDKGAARPDWPGIEALEPARAHRGRHGAISLPWQAALGALSLA